MLLCGFKLFAWNSVGHRVIAQMAYDQLTPAARVILLSYNNALNRQFARASFVASAVWLDQLYSPQLKFIRQMHYIDSPYTREKITINLPQPQRINVIWAIRLAINRLHMQQASALDKGLAVRFILHLIGDIHQPLHAITCISPQYPAGDRGGNLVRLKQNHVANNLHAYWDRGAGLWSGKWSAKKVQRMAVKLAQLYPCRQEDNYLDPSAWAQESYAIGSKFAYNYSENHILSADYQSTAQNIIAKRTALSACRLAAVLNDIALK